MPFLSISSEIKGSIAQDNIFLMLANNTPLTAISTAGKPNIMNLDNILINVLYPVVDLKQSIRKGKGLDEVLKDNVLLAVSISGNLFKIANAASIVANASLLVFCRFAIKV